MPTVLTPQGWVKVADTPKKRRTVAVDPAENLKGPLAYFSCKRTPPKVFPGVLHVPAGGKGRGSGPREAFPYDLNASPEKLRAQGRLKQHSQLDNVKIGGKNRTVSAPVRGMHMDDYDDRYAYYSDEDGAAEAGAVIPAPRSPRRRHAQSPPSSPSPSRVAVAAAVAAATNARSSSRYTDSDSKHQQRHHHHHHKSRHHHYDDSSSISSSSTSSSSYRSHQSHERARPVHAAPQPPVIMYATAPPPMPSGPRSYYNSPFDSGPRHAPPSSASGRSMSYSWYNATTPLNL